MNYQECRAYIDDSAKYGSVLGLDNMREMLGRLGNPQDDVPFVHVAGTNGKGSVIAYLYHPYKGRLPRGQIHIPPPYIPTGTSGGGRGADLQREIRRACCQDLPGHHPDDRRRPEPSHPI